MDPDSALQQSDQRLDLRQSAVIIIQRRNCIVENARNQLLFLQIAKVQFGQTQRQLFHLLSAEREHDARIKLTLPVPWPQ